MIPSDADESSLITDDQVVDQFHIQRSTGGDEARGDGQISWRGRGIAGGVIVYRDARGRAGGERGAKKRAWAGVGAVNIALRDLPWFADQSAARIKRQTPETFVIEQHQFTQVFDGGFWRGEFGPFAPTGGRRDAVGEFKRCRQLGRFGGSDAARFQQVFDLTAREAEQAIVFEQQAIGELEHTFVAAGAQQQCQQFGIAERLDAAVERFLARAIVVVQTMEFAGRFIWWR